ncbi:barstar family protein [Viridibacillus arvi]|uniref:barstar family protein n=1 Tax=Viridibacillus arvi TaxID=263475 RepID=UPI0036E723E0
MGELEKWRELIQNGSIILYWDTKILERNLKQLERDGFEIYSFDCALWNEENFHEELASTLNFPDYYGKNLDAFNDCLSDIVPKRTGIILTFKNYDIFTKRYPDIAYDILDIIQLNAWRNLIEGNVLMGFVQSNNGNFSMPPVGGMSPEWNSDEWLDKNREL